MQLGRGFDSRTRYDMTYSIRINDSGRSSMVSAAISGNQIDQLEVRRVQMTNVHTATSYMLTKEWKTL